MEADVCAQLVKSCEENGEAQMAILVGDDDSSTIKKVRDTLDHDVEKWSDIVHAKRAFASSLYGLQKSHKKLTAKVIDYLQKCFSYAVTQNKNDPTGVKNGLRAIVPHAFGDHGTCSISWCKYLKDLISYRHSTTTPWQRSGGGRLEKRPARNHRNLL